MSGIGAFTSLFENVRRSGKEYKVLCPCHDDSDPSLFLTEKNGKVLFTCRAGCPKSDLVEFFRRAGVLSGGPIPGSYPETFKGQLILERYIYTDATGKPLFYICRTAGKGFPVHSPAGKWGMDGAKPVLYNLPAVIKASHIWIVEGEKDAETLTRMGLTGTTSPGGAVKWKIAFNCYFKAKDVVILPDNDDPGRQHADLVASSLHPIAKSVKILELPDLPAGGDVSDWAKGRDPVDAAEDLCRLADGATEWKPARPVVCLADVKPEKVGYLWKPYLPKRKVALFEGDPGGGKTFLMLAVSAGLSRGCLPGAPRMEPANTLFLSAEDGLADTIRPRLDDLEADVGRIFAPAHPLVLTEEGGFEQLEALIADCGPVLVVLDPLFAFTGPQVNIHRSNDSRAVMARLARIAEKSGTTIAAIRHLTNARIDHRFGNEGDFGRPERFSESFAIDPVQVE